MKSIFWSLIILSGIPVFAWADISAAINDSVEKELEADHENLQGFDLDGELQMAKEQALVQEQVSRDSSNRLEAAKKGREKIQKKAEARLPVYEDRRKRAEYDANKANKQRDQLLNEIQLVQKKLDNALKRAKDKEDLLAEKKKLIASD